MAWASKYSCSISPSVYIFHGQFILSMFTSRHDLPDRMPDYEAAVTIIDRRLTTHGHWSVEGDN